jgi:prepilin-type N-terminal cleavage/methylation domain-containing protein
MHHPATAPAQRAFSLVELSIVLVILGLLIGGILSGQSLIRAAELRSISTDYNRYVTATQTFRDKYFALPGDMSNATSFWLATASCPGTAGTGTQTCNGNGNGMIETTGLASQYTEVFTFWQHLANAGLIEGSYTGISGPNNTWDASPTNSPMTKISTVGVSIIYLAPQNTAAVQWFAGNYGNTFYIGGKMGAWEYRNGFLKPEEMWNIDTKMDDGKPASGKILSFRPSWSAPYTDCATTSVEATAEYKLSHSGLACAIVAVTGF